VFLIKVASEAFKLYQRLRVLAKTPKEVLRRKKKLSKANSRAQYFVTYGAYGMRLKSENVYT
jgi:hypothetical protein